MERYVKLLLVFVLLINGKVHSLKSEALIGGRPAKPGDFKYLVSLQREDEHFCGGGILSDRHVITAAHCFIDEGNKFAQGPVKVVAGLNDLHASAGGVVANVAKVYVPKLYDDAVWASSIPLGDIAVLKLDQSLQLKRRGNLTKLRLPRKKDYEGEVLTIAGFGWDKVKVKQHKNESEYEIGSSMDRLFQAKAKVVPNEECQDYYSDVIEESKLCAMIDEHHDGKLQGVCRGDSGGPLVYKTNTIVGVVSGVSIGCNENDQPGVYCRVSSHLEFVKNAINDVTKGMRTKKYH